MSELCELCGREFTGLTVIWRYGFTAVCCVGCAGKLARLKRERRINFKAAKAKDMVIVLIRSQKATWESVTDGLLEQKRPLWEALAKV